jgi:hypothetical protein
VPVVVIVPLGQTTEVTPPLAPAGPIPPVVTVAEPVRSPENVSVTWLVLLTVTPVATCVDPEYANTPGAETPRLCVMTTEPVAAVQEFVPVPPVVVQVAAEVLKVATTGPVTVGEVPFAPFTPLVFSEQKPAAPEANVKVTVVTLPPLIVGAQVLVRCV